MERTLGTGSVSVYSRMCFVYKSCVHVCACVLWPVCALNHDSLFIDTPALPRTLDRFLLAYVYSLQQTGKADQKCGGNIRDNQSAPSRAQQPGLPLTPGQFMTVALCSCVSEWCLCTMAGPVS